MNGVPQANFANPAFPVMPPGVQPYPPAMMAANPAANVHQPQVSAQPVTLPPGPPHFGKAPSMQADQQTRPPSLFSTDSMDGRNEPLSPAGPNDAGGPPDLRGPPLTGPQQPVLPIPQDSQMAFGPAGAQPTDQKPHVPFAVAFMNIVRRTPRLLSMMVSFVGFILEIALVAQYVSRLNVTSSALSLLLQAGMVLLSSTEVLSQPPLLSSLCLLPVLPELRELPARPHQLRRERGDPLPYRHRCKISKKRCSDAGLRLLRPVCIVDICTNGTLMFRLSCTRRTT